MTPLAAVVQSSGVALFDKVSTANIADEIGGTAQLRTEFLVAEHRGHLTKARKCDAPS